MKAVIFCNGVINDYKIYRKRSFENMLIICADGGLRHARALGLMPDVIIGDNDSWEEKYDGAAADAYLYPRKKDLTDTQLCVDCAIDRGCSDIELIGGFGGRHDHEYSHYCLMAYALLRGVRLVMTDENNKVFMSDRPFVLKKENYKYVSFFPFGGCVENFTIKGLEYETNGMKLECNLVQATSNEFSASDTAEISFTDGIVLVMLCNDSRL